VPASLRPLLLAAGALLASAAPAAAITNGGPDGSSHPQVAALLAPTAYSDGTWEYCTGTLIAPTVVLTAAHCDEGTPAVRVSFASAYRAGSSTVYAGTFHADPSYTQSQSDPHDIAVIVLDRAVKGIAPARLPQAHALDGLTGAQTFTSVGYGAQSVTNGPGGKTFLYTDVRHVAVGTLNSLTPSFLRISQNASTGNGGTCDGDSGGPNFLGSGSGETNIIAGTTITGDTTCRSTNVDYRLDTASARSFLGAYVALP
jgi:V8-like Glu-specific endopeptidase